MGCGLLGVEGMIDRAGWLAYLLEGVVLLNEVYREFLRNSAQPLRIVHSDLAWKGWLLQVR